METFVESGLKEEVLKALGDLGFEKPTPIQAKAIPHLLNSGNDLVALAQTGTGKTAAFSLPIVEQVDVDDSQVQAFILSPTRELCLQIANDIKDFTKYLRAIKTIPVYGGASIDTQLRQLKQGGQIVVGTPGRVCDMIRRKKLDLSKIRWVVLDEADEMLSMGFKEELDFILEHTPEEKQTLLFSATMPKEIARIAKKYMREPEEIAAGTKNTGAKNVSHLYYVVQARDKYNALKRIADIHPSIYAIVFCRTRRETKEVADRLIQDGYNADALHGDLSQAQRDVVMHRFRGKHLQILVATDVAARGIDVNDLSHVINYSLPDQMESYIHRSGRTGRAGKTGTSIAIVSSRESRKIRALEKKVGKAFEQGSIPNGREICEIRLMNIVDNLQEVKVDEENIAEFMPAIYDKLKDLDKEQIIKHFVSVEFNRVLAYYRNAPDLNRGGKRDKDGKGRDRDRDREKRSDDRDDRRKRRSEVEFARFHINIGSKHKFTPPQLISLINDHPAIRKATVGEIEILKKFSFFDIDKDFKDDLLGSLNGKDFKGVTIALEPVKTSRPSGVTVEKKFRKKPRTGGGNRAKRSRERDKFRKKPRNRW